MSADETRKRIKALYESILGRNLYSQGAVKRQCVYHPYADGKYYSDCSSSILNTYYEAGALTWREGNTAVIHERGQLVDVAITNGVPEESALRVGDALLFRGNDPSRPLQIGHVEMYVGNNTLYGHGSNTPSAKNMTSYCKARQSQKAANGLTKGLVEVRRFIPDDLEETPIDAILMTAAELNYRSAPAASGKLLGTIREGVGVKFTKKCNRWFYAPDYGWMSAKYLSGWVQESGGRWWFLLPGYTWPAKTVQTINGEEYAFDRDGWMITADRIGSDGDIIY